MSTYSEKPDMKEILNEVFKFLKDRITPDDMSKLQAMLVGPDGQIHDKVEGAAEQYADDSASPIRAMQAFRQAETECAAFLDEDALSFDSAAKIYRHALRKMGIDSVGVAQTPSGNLRGLFLTMRNMQAGGGHLAADSASNTSAREKLLKDFPGVVLPRRVA